jgi:glycosyltransferase involved in cell wall biosynthesis
MTPAESCDDGGRPDVSVVIPCLNEEDNVEPIAAAVAREFERQPFSYEILFIDNASTDGTVALIKAMAAGDPRIKLIANLRNFGQMRSPTYGIYNARGRAVIGMCADFQDPPALIGPLLDRWRSGAKIVLAVRESERGSPLKRLGRAVGYFYLRHFADYPVIPNATGFGLYDREVVDCLKRWNEPEPFFRGMLVESGFAIETISYPRANRMAGQSKNNLFRLLDFMLSAISSSSKKMLRAPFVMAAVSLLAACATLLLALVLALYGRPFVGAIWAFVIELQFVFLFGFLGLLGDQIRLISERTRNVPLVIEKERVNFDVPER